MTDFALGDIVVMKMGGPWMTVVGYGHRVERPGYSFSHGVAIEDRSEVNCVWFDAEHRLQRDHFNVLNLKPVELVA